MITVKHPFGSIDYTEEELEQEMSELTFLRDAFLVILNEEVVSKSDIPYNKAEVLEYAKQMYYESSYSNDFIDECFKNKSDED